MHAGTHLPRHVEGYERCLTWNIYSILDITLHWRPFPSCICQGEKSTRNFMISFQVESRGLTKRQLPERNGGFSPVKWVTMLPLRYITFLCCCFLVYKRRHRIFNSPPKIPGVPMLLYGVSLSFFFQTPSSYGRRWALTIEIYNVLYWTGASILQTNSYEEKRGGERT